MASQTWHNGAMNGKITARLLLDFVFIILILCAFAYRIIGDAAHEWIGVSVFVVGIVHNALNWKWYQNIFRGAYTFRRGIMTAVNFFLAVLFAALIVTGLLHSRTVLAFLRLPGGAAIRQIHTTAAYWGIPLIGVHIGLHWGMIQNTFRKMLKIKSEDRMRKIIAHIVALVLVLFGVWSSFDRDMFSKLFLGFSFDYWPEERPAVLFFAVNLSIMGVYVFGAYYALKLRERKSKQEQSAVEFRGPKVSRRGTGF